MNLVRESGRWGGMRLLGDGATLQTCCSTLEPQNEMAAAGQGGGGETSPSPRGWRSKPTGRAMMSQHRAHGCCASSPRCAYRTPPPVLAAAQRLPPSES